MTLKISQTSFNALYQDSCRTETSSPPISQTPPSANAGAIPAGTGRSAFLAQVDLNQLKVQNRFNNLFSMKQPAQCRKSWDDIRSYLINSGVTSPPPSLYPVMAFLDAVCLDVHRAIPHGRGNVLIKNRDTLAPGERGERDEDLNRKEAARKTYLALLGEAVFHRLEGEFFETPESDEEAAVIAKEKAQDEALQLGACGVLAGSAGCQAYACLFAAAAAYRCNLAGLKGLKFDVVKAPEVDGNKLDHVICRVSYKAPDGQTYSFSFDPWGNVNTLFIPHAPYEKGDLLCSFDSSDEAGDYKTKISEYLDEGKELIEEVRESKEFRESVLEAMGSIMSADDKKKYSLKDSHEGFFSLEELNMVRSGVHATVRRPSMVSPQESDLIKE